MCTFEFVLATADHLCGAMISEAFGMKLTKYGVSLILTVESRRRGISGTALR